MTCGGSTITQSAGVVTRGPLGNEKDLRIGLLEPGRARARRAVTPINRERMCALNGCPRMLLAIRRLLSGLSLSHSSLSKFHTSAMPISSPFVRIQLWMRPSNTYVVHRPINQAYKPMFSSWHRKMDRQLEDVKNSIGPSTRLYGSHTIVIAAASVSRKDANFRIYTICGTRQVA